MIKKYKSFYELKKNEQHGVDYVIQIRKGSSGMLVMAPHGGGIEPGTLEIADSIAGSKHSFYCFKGIKISGNATLHIASHGFDEPEGQKMAASSDLVIAIHGCIETAPVILMGGRNQILKTKLSIALSHMDIVVHENPRSEISGIKSTNICNRGKKGQGVQIEFSQGLRKLMFEKFLQEPGKGKTPLFYDIVSALRKTLDLYNLDCHCVQSA